MRFGEGGRQAKPWGGGTHLLLDSWTHFVTLLQVDLCMTHSAGVGGRGSTE